MSRVSSSAFLFGLALCIAGCADSTPKGPSLAKVTGTVNLDGKAMGGGEVRFGVPGFPAKTMPINDGKFSGEAHSGKNQIDVVWEKEGPPHPMDPKMKIMVNAVSDKYSGPNSKLNTEVKEGGPNDFKFDVTSK